MRELLNLLKDAGHSNFREARGPMGFTQRQATGKFTRDEATEFIDRLQDAEFGGATGPEIPVCRPSATDQLMRHMPVEELVAELQRRGWTVAKP
jgi:hypothetical protein